MKLSTLLLSYVAAFLINGTVAWPYMAKTLDSLNQRLQERADPVAGPEDSDEMIGDLATVGATTPVGKSIKSILLGLEDPYSDVAWSGVLPGKGSPKCAADTCCIWGWIAKDMEQKFRGTAGRCNGLARAAVRLGFHDAGTWSKNTPDYGGADGSIILANELGRPENSGLQKIGDVMKDWYDQYKKYGISMADLIQMGATVATVVCPLGPRVRSFVGRKDSSKPAVDGLLPDVFADADSLIQLFAAKTIKAHGLAALVGAHTTSRQRFVNTSRALDPQDSTPGVWDVVFYGQTIDQPKPPKRVFKFPSDSKLAAHPKIQSEWQQFAGSGGQDHWNEASPLRISRASMRHDIHADSVRRRTTQKNTYASRSSA
jgi:hypothetical protein